MLKLTRKTGERIVCELADGQTITIELCKVRSQSQAQIGVRAPAGVEIWREEVYEGIVDERRRGEG